MAERAKKLRSVIRSGFTRFANEAQELLAGPVGDTVVFGRKVQKVLRLLTERHDTLMVANVEVAEALIEEDATEEALEEEAQKCCDYNDTFQDLLEALEEARSKELVVPSIIGAGANSTCGSSAPIKHRYRLPKIELPKFSGELKEWLPFWHRFRKIHEDKEMDRTDKIQYLLQATVPGSKARRAVEKFPAVSENYQKIVESLKARYGRQDIQVEIRIRELLRIVVNVQGSLSKSWDVTRLYDAIDTEMKALETLKVTAERYAPILYPLVESCLPEGVLRLWQRSREFSEKSRNESNASDDQVNGELETRLCNLMVFLRNEVENEQRVSLAKEGFGLKVKQSKQQEEMSRPSSEEPTAAAFGTNAIRCAFCNENHATVECLAADKLTLSERRNLLMKRGLCFRCCKDRHRAMQCRSQKQCARCKRRHETVMCSEAEEAQKAMCNQSTARVFLQTLRIMASGKTKGKAIRVMLDSGSQRSYILNRTAKELGLVSTGAESFMHELFGGKVTGKRHHDIFRVSLSNENTTMTFEVLGQPVISNNLSHICEGPWMQELECLGICLSDVQPGPVELLIGADYIGDILSGKCQKLKCGLSAMETCLGWTVLGKTKEEQKLSATFAVFSSFLSNSSVSNLWELDVLGIEDPVQAATKKEAALAAKDLFSKTTTMDEDGRYEVCLPWLSGHPRLPPNRTMAEKRLKSTMGRLKKLSMVKTYGEVFNEWLEEGIIELVEGDASGLVHYLPHHPVIKAESLTTKVRPVFDASAREAGCPSLNDCLETGINLIELIPKLLLRFRLYRVGVVADIRKAFLMVGLSRADRDVLRFLWEDENGDMLEFRHKRVVFGVKCSPFLLGATIQYHLEECRKKISAKQRDNWSAHTIEELQKSFYVDNCVTSFEDVRSVDKFRKEAQSVMLEGLFDLRAWEHSQDGQLDGATSVLGLAWHKQEDTLRISHKSLGGEMKSSVTKRLILSVAQGVFDPMGFVCPVLLLPKLLLQSLWKEEIGWDKELSGEVRGHFLAWWEQLAYLKSLRLPRWIGGTKSSRYSLHVFCDASQVAYAAVVYLRTENENGVTVRLLMAKTRVAPLKILSIPRLELMSATIASRLYDIVKGDFFAKADAHFWTDSMTALAWIRRSEDWAPFVGNRVKEIRSLTDSARWRHVPGTMNPADKPSRGCTASQLAACMEWWEGPTWLNLGEKEWLTTPETCDEEVVMSERKRRVVHSMTNVMDYIEEFHLSYFSKHQKTVRMVAWIFRFVFNCRNPRSKLRGQPTVGEMKKAEMFVLAKVQRDVFEGIEDEKLKQFCPFLDEDGLIRMRSRISNRLDERDFRHPILLPAKHVVVFRMLYDMHVAMCHVGTTGLLSVVRERFWIIGGRRAVRSVVKRCIRCRRYGASAIETPIAPLPSERVRDAVPFEVVGIDFAGPLRLKSGDKCWVCIFTCAVYRAVHLELSCSLSSAAFLQVLRRFIARRGRPAKIFSDNGTNFKGVANFLGRVEWSHVGEYLSVERIAWVFNPPGASWWGGFWERLIALLKQLLRKTLGRASLKYEELTTVLCDCEAVLNDRPITYVSDEPGELGALTPNMFLREAKSVCAQDCDVAERNFMGKRARYQQRIRDGLRKRFRNEYLGQLQLKQRRTREYKLQIGELVLIGDESKKRLDWTLGRIEEMIMGPDNVVRLVRVRTQKGLLLRPVQKIFPLECGTSSGDGVKDEPVQKEPVQEDPVKEVPIQEEAGPGGVRPGRLCDARDDGKVRTRLGRVVKRPVRLDYN